MPKAKPTANKPTTGQRPVPRHEQQLAVIGDTGLDIEAAFRLLRASPRPTVRIDVDAWARLYGKDGKPNSPIRLGPLFDPDHAATARRPLILIPLTLDNEQLRHQLEDAHKVTNIATRAHDHGGLR